VAKRKPKTETEPGTETGALSFAKALSKLLPQQRLWVQYYLQTFSKTEAAVLAGYGDPDNPNHRNCCKSEGHRTSNLPHVKVAVEAGFREMHMSPAEIIARLEAQATGDVAEFFFPVEYEVDVFEDVSLHIHLDYLRKKLAIAEDLRDRFKDRAPMLFNENKDKALRLEQQIVEVELTLEQNPKATISMKTGTRTETRWEIDIIKAREAGLSHLVQEISYDQRGQPKLKLADKVKSQELLGKYHKLWAERMEHEGGLTITLKKETVGEPLD
jgi:hypothetical protein